MKLKDVLSKLSVNRRNGQMTTCIKKNKLKTVGINEKELLEMKLEPKLKRLLRE